MTHVGNPYLTGGSAISIGAEGASAAGSPTPGEQKAGPAGPLSHAWIRAGLGLVVPLLLLALWQLASALGIFSTVQLPSPGAVLASAADLLDRGTLGTHMAISTQRVLTGFAAGAVLGLLLGALLGLSRLADVLLGPLFGAVRAVPSLALVPLLILWMGIGENSKVTLITIGAFFPVFTTVSLALRHVDKNLVEAARAFGLNGVKLLTTVQLPAVVPAVFAGLRLALAQSWLFLVAAELIASSMGLGFLLTDSQNNGRTDRMFLAIVLLAVIGKATDALLGLAERWAVKKWA